MRKAKNALLFISLCLTLFIAAIPATAATRKADVKTPSAGNMFVYFEGTFDTSECKKALNRINAIRKEACNEGIINPSTGSPLKSSDYKPVKWSADLERIAQTRAAEAAICMGHTRPNGQSCFTVKYNGTQSWGEVLAWNWDGMVYGVNQWYGEKDDWINNTGNVTGHYTQMIDPKNTYIGLGSFVLSSGGWICISGEFSSASSLTSKYVGVSGVYKQAIEVPKKDVKASLTSYTVKKGKTKKIPLVMKYSQTDYYGNKVYLKGTAYGTVTWKSSNTSVASVSKYGVVSAKKAGKTTITATVSGKKASCTVTVK